MAATGVASPQHSGHSGWEVGRWTKLCLFYHCSSCSKVPHSRILSTVCKNFIKTKFFTFFWEMHTWRKSQFFNENRSSFAPSITQYGHADLPFVQTVEQEERQTCSGNPVKSYGKMNTIFFERPLLEPPWSDDKIIKPPGLLEIKNIPYIKTLESLLKIKIQHRVSSIRTPGGLY